MWTGSDSRVDIYQYFPEGDLSSWDTLNQICIDIYHRGKGSDCVFVCDYG